MATEADGASSCTRQCCTAASTLLAHAGEATSSQCANGPTKLISQQSTSCGSPEASYASPPNDRLVRPALQQHGSAISSLRCRTRVRQPLANDRRALRKHP